MNRYITRAGYLLVFFLFCAKTTAQETTALEGERLSPIPTSQAAIERQIRIDTNELYKNLFLAESGLLKILQRKGTKEELELIEDQHKAIAEVEQQVKKRISHLKESFLDKLGDLDRAELESQSAKIRSDTENSLQEILIPTQIQALKSLAAHQDIRRNGLFYSLVRGTLAEEIELTDDERRSLLEKSKERDAELRKLTAEFRQETSRQLLKILAPDKRRAIEKIVGEKRAD